MSTRTLARSLFTEALAAVTVPAAFARHLSCNDHTLHAGGRTYDLTRYDEVLILSLGKAGATMFDALDAVLPATTKRRAIVSAPFAPQHLATDVTFFQGGHPEPNAASLDAARASLDLLHTAAPDALIVFLISGGASAMFELPFNTITLDDTIALNRLLVGSGASITEINAVRKHLSRVKGGRLAEAAGTRDQLTLLVSDVPEGALDALGSGPSIPDTSTVADALDVLTRYDLLRRLPTAWQGVIAEGLDETPKPGAPAFANAHVLTMLDNAAMLEQVALLAEAQGYRVVIDNTCDDWDYTDAATYLMQRLESEAPGKLCLLSGGEVTVRLPDAPGKGGRNQQFVLACAVAGIPEGVTILCAGTDGIDGASPAAGAVADATTRQRAEAAGLSLEDHLAHFNAFPLFAALGDAILTGPTGNNLRDLRILLRDR